MKAPMTQALKKRRQISGSPRIRLDVEDIDCPFCGADEHIPWARENGYTAVRCAACGVVYVNPRPSLSTISEASKTGVHKTATSDMSVAFRRSRRKIFKYSAIIREIFAPEIATGKPLSWLDVGAGYGEFLEAVLAAIPPGGVVRGMEPMQPKVAVARSRGLPIVDTPLGKMKGQFDVISLINVFSHIPDFEGFLKQLTAHSSRAGILFIETGNGGDLTRREYPDELFLPDHLVFAGVKHISSLLEKLGFRVEAVHQYRVDTATWAVKRFAKGLLRGRFDMAVPYTSPFRTIFFKARRI